MIGLLIIVRKFSRITLCVSACLSGAEALPDIEVGKRKFNINIVMPSSDQTGELRLSFETVRKFATIF